MDDKIFSAVIKDHSARGSQNNAQSCASQSYKRIDIDT